jgi:aminopeptidase N
MNPTRPLRTLALACAVLFALPISHALAQSDPPPPAPTSDQPAGAAKPIKDPEPAASQPRDPRIDAATGRDKRVWPTDPIFNHRKFKLEMLVPDMSKHEFTATATITLSPIAAPQSTITLDAGPGLTFTSITVDKAPVPGFNHDPDKQKLTVTLPRAFKPAETFILAMTYDAVKPGGRGDGLTWSKDDTRTPEVDYMMHAQGEPQHNHLWFPCHDFPNLRVPTEIFVTVPEPYEAISNGKLLGVTKVSYASLGLTPPPVEPDTIPEPSDNQPPRTSSIPHQTSPSQLRTFHWSQTLPHSYYLQTLIISRFDVVNVGGPNTEFPGLWMPVYGALGSGEAIRTSFANTPAMIAHFSTIFEYKYPWDKYAQVICRDFSAGAMENTGVVTFNTGLGRGGRRGSIDDTISHELAHHWFGDLVTCKSWEHIWLNEGFATLGEALWAEKVRGEQGYQAAILRNFERERASSRNRSAPTRPPMASNLYTNPDSRFTSGDNCYSKGGSILHMLRMRLGDKVFFRAVSTYLQKHAFTQVETDDFRLVLEEASGQSLERFFDQWCRRPGHPSLDVDLSTSGGPPASAPGDDSLVPNAPTYLTISITQTQKIDADNPAYAIEIPVWISYSDKDGDGEWRTIVCDTKQTKNTITLTRKPVDVQVDPDLTVLCRHRIRQPLDHALNRIRGRAGDATLAARLDALDQLKDSSDPRATAALALAAIPRSIWGDSPYIDDPSTVLRQAALAALSEQSPRMTSTIQQAALEALREQRALAGGHQ